MDQTQEVAAIAPTMTLAEAEKLVGTGVSYDHKLTLQCFDVQFWVNVENDEDKKNLELILAKNTILRSLVEHQILKTGKFDFSDIPLKNYCLDCRGTGELYKLERKSIEEGCKKCATNAQAIEFLGERYDPNKFKAISNRPEDADKSSGRRIVKCRKCEKGRYKKGSHDSGLVINVECRTCHGTAEVLVKCKTCRGKKFIKKNVLAGKVESTTKCRTCHGKGFQTPEERKKSEPENPLMPSNIGEAIKGGEVPKELDANLTQSQKK